jgi:hypothetical protein
MATPPAAPAPAGTSLEAQPADLSTLQSTDANPNPAPSQQAAPQGTMPSEQRSTGRYMQSETGAPTTTTRSTTTTTHHTHVTHHRKHRTTHHHVTTTHHATTTHTAPSSTPQAGPGQQH